MSSPQASYLPSTAAIAGQFYPSGHNVNSDIIQVFNSANQCIWRITAAGTFVGGVQPAPITVSTNSTVTPTNPNVYVAGGPPSGLTITLETLGQTYSAGYPCQEYFVFNQTGIGPVTVVGQTGTINGEASFTLQVGQCANFIFNASVSAPAFTADLQAQA
jgi:hypothetical protein